MTLPWVSRRTYDLAVQALEQSREDCRAMREAIQRLVDRNVALTDPWALMQARIAEREAREGLIEGEAGMSGREKKPVRVHLIERL